MRLCLEFGRQQRPDMEKTELNSVSLQTCARFRMLLRWIFVRARTNHSSCARSKRQPSVLSCPPPSHRRLCHTAANGCASVDAVSPSKPPPTAADHQAAIAGAPSPAGTPAAANRCAPASAGPVLTGVGGRGARPLTWQVTRGCVDALHRRM